MNNLKNILFKIKLNDQNWWKEKLYNYLEMYNLQKRI